MSQNNAKGQGHKTMLQVNVTKQRNGKMFYLTMHSTHFIYGYMASDIWLRTILIVRKETRCCHMGTGQCDKTMQHSNAKKNVLI